MESVKKTKGKQKIEMKLIQNEEDRSIAFTKRKAGIYKKLSEIVTLCGAEVAFVVLSKAGKPYGFAHPSMETVIDRFLDRRNIDLNDNMQSLAEARRLLQISEITEQYNAVVRRLDLKKDQAKSVEISTKNKEVLGWWNAPANQLDPEELKHMYTTYTDIHKLVLTKIIERNIDGRASSSSIRSMNPTALGIDPFASSGSGINSTSNQHVSAQATSQIDPAMSFLTRNIDMDIEPTSDNVSLTPSL